MIIEFKAKNFRSIKDEIVLSFEANTSKSKENNFFLVQSEAEEHKLTKSIAIYGANASGKSNIIIAFNALLHLIKHSHKNEVNSPIVCYEPFLFDTAMKKASCEFTLVFIVDGKKYKLEVEYDKNKITKEKLSYYETKRDSVLYERFISEEISHNVQFGRKQPTEGAKKEVLSNQLYLSKFNTEIHSVLTHLCAYFKTIEVEVSDNKDTRTKFLNDRIAEEIIIDKKGPILKTRLQKLINIADIQVVDIKVEEVKEENFKFPENFPTKLKQKIIDDNKWNIEFVHKSFNENTETGTEGLSLNEESLGTQVLFGLGARILQTLENGGTLIYDEINNSLHPQLSRLLVNLFNNNISNPKNAQLIFTTHEVSLIDREMLRSDQIWFVEKNEKGVSDLYSAQDFDGIREDIAFDKWYQAGRFGGLPSIGDFELIFEQ